MVSGRRFTAAQVAALALIFGIVGAAGLNAQAGTSIIAGIVRDSSGAAVPGATVRVVNENTRTAREIISNEAGSYRAAAPDSMSASLEIVEPSA